MKFVNWEIGIIIQSLIKLSTLKNCYERPNSVYLDCFEKLDYVAILGKHHVAPV